MKFRDNIFGDKAGELYESVRELAGDGDEGMEEEDYFDFIGDDVQTAAVNRANKGNYDDLVHLSQEYDFQMGRFASDYLSALEEGAEGLLQRAGLNEDTADEFLEKAEEGARDKISLESNGTEKRLGEIRARSYLSTARSAVEYLNETDPSEAGQVQDRRKAFKMLSVAENFADHFNLDEQADKYSEALETLKERDREMGMHYGKRKARRFNDFAEMLNRE